MIDSTPLPVSVAELRGWLRLDVIAEEEALLTQLLRTASAQCAHYIGQRLLRGACETLVAADGAWHVLPDQPVQAIIDVQALDVQGKNIALPVANYEITISPQGLGEVRVIAMPDVRIRVQYNAGLAATPEELPAALRQGILRLAAYHYANRDGSEMPPAAVGALWQAYRRLQL